MKLTWKKCQCGHSHCKIMQPEEIGHFYQGTGFNEADRKLVDDAFALLEEKPTAYLHEIEEPERGSRQMFSMLADNPWSHWSEENRLQCTYRCTPLYAGTTVETKP